MRNKKFIIANYTISNYWITRNKKLIIANYTISNYRNTTNFYAKVYLDPSMDIYNYGFHDLKNCDNDDKFDIMMTRDDTQVFLAEYIIDAFYLRNLWFV